MCDNCENNSSPLFDFDALMEAYADKLESITALHNLFDQLTAKDQEFAGSLISSFVRDGGLSPRQWHWVGVLVDRVKGAEPLYGDFDAIHVMFRVAGEHLKRSKVRLMTKEDTFVQLNFDPETKDIKVYRDGWQGHGFRKFVGWIRENSVIPYRSDRLTDDIMTLLHEFSLDPQAVAKAMAGKLGACLYCGQRLSDDESKRRGYGKTCASHFGLPWGRKAA